MYVDNEKFQPGAAKFGNFINYYSFNSVDERIKLLSCFEIKLIEIIPKRLNYLCLDVGCNTGEMTKALHSSLSTCLPCKNQGELEKAGECFILAVDIDPILIERAKMEPNPFISFHCVDIMTNEFNDTSVNFLDMHSASMFDIGFLFSVTMWIHLNHGDEKLCEFLKKMARVCNVILIESQPWKCYKTAVRRMRKLKMEIFPQWEKLRMRESVEKDIEAVLCDSGMFKVFETPASSWGRRISCFRKITSI